MPAYFVPMSDFFGLPGIFDNVRDGLILVRFPQGEIVLCNRAAGQMCSADATSVVGTDFAQLLVDPELQARARNSARQAVGQWPGHDQEAVLTEIKSGSSAASVEVSICRVEDAGTGGPLVLFVMRPSLDVTVEDTIRKLAVAQPVGPAV